ncbi:hypothetical protein B296_00023552 [Ensete ventricosum]|uniref:Uncharacterized protein n=1 Tax=Ensete ventricosum TaxID=4639 RepID=A0A426ZM80_ENSVE|nr:hypothetical protein B296_00023552 [Ensete ventricosum]
MAVADGKGGASEDRGSGNNGVGGSSFALQVRFVFSFSGFLGDFGLVGRLDGKDWFLLVSHCWIGLRRGGLVILVE